MWHLAVPSFPARAEGLVLSFGLVQTILTTFVALLITWAVTSFQQRKRLAWRDYLDAPVNLDRSRPAGLARGRSCARARK